MAQVEANRLLMTDCLKYVHYLLGAAELGVLQDSRDRLGGRELKSQLRWWGDRSNSWGTASWVFWVSGSGCSSLQGICTPSSRSRVFSFCWSLTILQGTFFTYGWCLPTYNQNYNIHVISPSATSLTEWFFCTAFKGFQHSKLFFYQTALKLAQMFRVLPNLQHITGLGFITGLKPEWN